MFAISEHKFANSKHMFANSEHMSRNCEHKISPVQNRKKILVLQKNLQIISILTNYFVSLQHQTFIINKKQKRL